MNLLPYPEYKDSGVPWLGRIPKHWECLPHRAIFSEIKDQGHVNEPLLSVTITKGIIPQSELLANSSKKDSSNIDKSKYKLVCPDDIAYNKMRAWQGAIGVSQFRGIISPAYVVVRLRRNSDPRYFHYLLRTPSFAKEAERWSYGITPDMWSLRPEHFKLIYSCLPQIEEQAQIARFLDWKTAQINKFIRNKRRLIELLKEQKQNIISKAVTRGLDPNVKLKPSGVEWIGDIPEHWEVRRLKFLSKGMLQYGANEQSGRKDLDCPRYVRITDIKDNGELKDDTFCTIPKDIAEPYLLNEGDILFARSGATVGKTFCYQRSWGEAAYAGYLIRAKIDDKIVNHEFVFQFTRSRAYLNWINSSFVKATIQNISAEKYASLWITLPSLEEQKSILEFIENESELIDQAITRAEREIELIREYRARLISDVVTGQVDVRGIEVPELAEDDLPALDEDDAEADEMMDDEGDMDEND
jgi:type I restriction enzyme S subunit